MYWIHSYMCNLYCMTMYLLPRIRLRLCSPLTRVAGRGSNTRRFSSSCGPLEPDYLPGPFEAPSRCNIK